ncbi:MAG: dipeptidase PepE [Chloroflexota bacterium]
MSVNLFLLSTSRVYGGGFLEFARDEFVDFLAGQRSIVFVPFARADPAEYTSVVAQELSAFGVEVRGIENLDASTAQQSIASAEVVLVGGGNTFRLLKRMQSLDLLTPIRERVASGGLKYVGSSAGTNMACPTLRTTNDMPIVQPDSFDAIGLVPFQINPHYMDADPTSTHMGETREQRIREFLEENDVSVLGLREGAWVRRSDGRLTLGGVASARLFQRGADPRDFAPGSDLSWLLGARMHFDRPLS